ncbi:xylulokinase [Marinibactrum halimedae]|uniref:Xylulose kinase n=1 Tax=Marinibactrum halimedae TaxID=1444977 RepID=A0AA37WNU5_9GAMM|nr:xylulokinase [Marinibactrum halimedae]MCD9461215.1 xylulokinase [Marinibactrum halimedae]GLS25282.1 xylulokinase [Marinibactrum halimedae]
MSQSNSTPLYLGIDLGTQSLKAVLFDPTKSAVVASESSKLDVDRDDEGKAEQNASDWLQAFENAVTALPSDLRQQIAAVGVSGQQHGFVPVDANGEVLTPVKLWCDTATQKECDELYDAVGGPSAAIAHSGNAIVTGYTAPKVRWLKNNNPDAYAKLAHILLPHDYLNFVLTGKYTMEMGDASGTGLLNVQDRCWSAEMISAIDSERDLRHCLPDLIEAHDIAGEVTDKCAQWLGIPAGIPVSCGGGDNMMAAIGTGNVKSGSVTMSLGTSGTVFATSDTPVIAKDGSIAAFCSSTGAWLPLLCTMNCTISTEIMRDLLNAPLDEFDDLIHSAKPGCDGVLTLPFFNGERTPNLPNGKGCVLGLTSTNTTRGNLLRSAAEGATFALRYGLESLITNGLKPTRIILTGGGSGSAQWRQMVADICGLPVVVLEQDEGAALGAALQALWVTNTDGSQAALEELCEAHLALDDSRSCQPNADTQQAYQVIYKRYQQAVSVIANLYE